MPLNRSDVARTVARRARVLELRKAGASYREIAEQTHVSLRTAWRDVKTELGRLAEETRETTSSLRALEMQRLDRLQLSHWSKAVGFTDKDGKQHPPDIKAADVVLRIMDRRARLLGLDAPQQVEMAAIIGDMTSEDLRTRVREKLLRLADGLPVIELQPVVPQLGEPGGNGHGSCASST